MKEEKQLTFNGDPAPWRIASKKKDIQFYVIHANDPTSKTPREVQVCKIHYGFHPINEQLNKTEANARLISAAPELLYACQKMLEQVGMLGNDLLAPECELMATAVHKALNFK